MTENDTTPLTGRSALALASSIRRGEISARAVVEAHISVLQRWQPKINAIAVERFEDARAEADGADDRVAAAATADRLPTLLGVPCIRRFRRWPKTSAHSWPRAVLPASRHLQPGGPPGHRAAAWAERDGSPVGVQVAAGPYRDHVAIAVAMALEQAYGGWSPPGAS